MSNKFFVTQNFNDFFLPRCFDSCDEELGAVAVLARVGHREDKLLVLQLEVLIVEGVPVNAGKHYKIELTMGEIQSNSVITNSP